MPEIKRYSLDPTGYDANNLVVGERHTLSNARIRALVPQYGPIYANNKLQLWDAATGRLLVRKNDYIVSDLLKEASSTYRQEIVETILIISQDVGDEVVMNCQVLGGLYQNSVDAVIKAYTAFTEDERVVDYANVMNKPYTWTPSLHSHMADDTYGYHALCAALERVRNAITLTDVPAYEQLIAWIKSRGMTLEEFMAGTAGDKFVTGEVLYWLCKKLGVSWTVPTVDYVELYSSCCLMNPEIDITPEALAFLWK